MALTKSCKIVHCITSQPVNVMCSQMCPIYIFVDLQPFAWNLNFLLHTPVWGITGEAGICRRPIRQPAHMFILAPYWHFGSSVLTAFELLLIWFQSASSFRLGYDDNYQYWSFFVIEHLVWSLGWPNFSKVTFGFGWNGNLCLFFAYLVIQQYPSYRY